MIFKPFLFPARAWRSVLRHGSTVACSLLLLTLAPGNLGADQAPDGVNSASTSAAEPSAPDPEATADSTPPEKTQPESGPSLSIKLALPPPRPSPSEASGSDEAAEGAESKTGQTSALDPSHPPTSETEEENSDAAEGSVDAPAPAPRPVAPAGVKTLTKEEQVGALKDLIAGKLATDIEPRDLFGFDFNDPEKLEKSVEQLKKQLERRLKNLAAAAVMSSPLSNGSGSPEGVATEAGKTTAEASKSGTSYGKATEGQATAGKSAEDTTKKAKVVQSVDTDPKDLPQDTETQLLAQKLTFLKLPESKRAALLKEHTDRKKSGEENAQSNEARERAQLAEQARLQALEDARRARTEAERLIAEEMARLLTIKRKQAEFDAQLAQRKTTARALEERYLSLQRRAGMALASGDESQIIALHSECETFAQETQEAFGTAIRYSPLKAPEAGENPLLDAGLTIDISKVQNLRSSLEKDAERLNEESTEVRWQRRDQLYNALRGTNEQRLLLFEALPADLKNAELGLSATGLGRAAFEIRQVLLILRYHMQVTSHWVERVRDGHRAGGASTIMTGAVFAQLFVLLWIYLWARKRLPLLLDAAKERGAEPNSSDYSRASMAALQVLSDIQRPLLFLGFLWAIYTRLPAVAQSQFEISLIYYAAIWLSSANLLIQLINSVSSISGRSIHSSLATVRLRSLRLVGRTGAYIGLVLSLTSQLVGRGTIYHWVIQVTWLLVVPTILLLCLWWRPLVHAYIETERRKSPFREWVIRHKTGIVGLLGAGLAGLDLIRVNVVRALRTWADEFVLTRRVGAYLFQRELDRRAVEEPSVELQPLPEALFDKLSPSEASVELAAMTGDEDCKVIYERTKRKRGGIFAVIGERGAGKSSHVRRMAEGHKTLVIEGKDTLEELEVVFNRAAGTASLAEAISKIDTSLDYELVVIEGAHQLIRPWIGGIAAFDQLISLIVPHAQRLGWVLTFEDSVWNFYGGARGTRPTFDEAIYLKSWSESDIRKLLELRCSALGLNPDFHLLVSALPKDADEIDRLEALEKAKKSLYRLIWDYAAGNPGVALHMWRRSLAVSATGDVYVQLFQAPRAEELEDLPDNAAFVLRAIVQLGNASLDEITRLTRLNPRLIQDTIRYARTVGVLEPNEEGYAITWLWYRAVTRFLHRRHLLSIRNLSGAGVA